MQDATTDLINAQRDWLDPVADTVQNAVAQAYEAGGEAGQAMENFLHGTWLGHPLHAALTDIPLGSWTAALVMDAMEEVTGREEFGVAADAAVAIGLTGAAAAAAAGLTDWHKTDGEARRAGIVHGLLNIGGTLLYGASLSARRSGARNAGRGLSALGFVVAMGAAWLGGQLVYSHRIGTDHSRENKLPDTFTPVLREEELQEGQMRKVDACGAPILLAQSDGRVYAINDVCSHLGGPLDEGEYDAASCTVKCPWHGSRFSVKDGRVLDGPAVHPQPSLEVRLRDGYIEVRTAAKAD